MAEVPVPRPESDKESHRIPKTNGETRPKEQKGQGQAQGQEEAQRRRDLERERAAQKPPVEISFREAKKIAEVVTAVQAEKKVIVSPKELADFKNVLAKSGYQPKAIEQMTDSQIVVAAQQILKNAKIGQAEKSDWQYAKNSPNREAEEALVREQIAQAQSLDEKQLTPEKVTQFLKVEEFAKAAEGGGPGAMDRNQRIERWVDKDLRDIENTLGQLTQLARTRHQLGDAEFNRRGLNADWDRLNVDLNERQRQVEQFANARSYKEVYEFAKIIDNAIHLAEHPITPPPPGEPGPIQLLGTFLPEDRRNNVISLRDNLNRNLERIYESMDDDTRQVVLGDLELDLQNSIDQLRIGLTLDQFKSRVFGGRGKDPETGEERWIPGIVQRGIDKEPDWAQGIREWRATTEVDGVETRLGIELLTQPPARWQEVPQRLANIYRFIESTDFTVEQLSASIQKAIQMVETVQRNNPDGRRQLAQLNKELKAFQAFHSFRVTMERADMRPEKVLPVFESYFDNETWKNFVVRFSKDSRGRQFLDAQGNSINLFDVAEQLYFEQLQKERVRMNEIEEMTKRELNLDTNNIDEKWFILKLIKSDEDFEVLKLALGRLPVDWEDMTAEQKRNQLKNLLSDEDRRRVLSEEEINRGFANLSQADRDKLINRENGINKKIWGIDINKTKTAINDWYEQNTLLGALGHLGERRGEMVAELKRRLAGLQVKGERLEDQPRDIDRDEFERSGFLESIDYNAYHFVWSLAWSDYDIIRIYGREAAGKDDPMIKAVAYNQSSFMFFGRYTDHIWEFLTDELRGRWAGEREVNEIVRKMFPGKHHGLFDGNRTMVRFARFFGLDEEKKKSLGIIDRTDELMKENDFRHSDPEINKAFRDWAERIAIAEAIDTGKLSFGEVGFSKNAGEMKKYEMTDLFLDREFTVKYFWKDNFQAYLSDPSSERFLKINNKETIFYSGRNVRLWPWMTLALRAHWELGSKHTLRLFNKPNFTSANTESIVDNLVAEGSMERKQAEHEKKKLFGFSEIGSIHLGEFFGTLPFRRARQNMETMRRLGWDSKFLLFVALLAGFGAGLVEMSKQLPKQLSEGLTGTR